MRGIATVTLLTTALALTPPAAEAQSGSFEAAVQVGSNAEVVLTGYCISSGKDDQWYTQMVTPGGGSTILMIFSGGNPPNTGEYPVADFIERDAEPRDGEFIASGSTGEQKLIISGFHSVTGKVLITSSSAASVEGTFSFSARVGQPGGEPVRVSGTFTSAAKD